MIGTLPTQTITFSSLVTEKIDFSTWNDSKFHAITPLIHLKAGELTRLVIEKHPEACSLEDVHPLNDSDAAIVEIVGTVFEREPADLNARSLDEDVTGYDTTHHVADVLNYLDKETFDKLLLEVHTIQSKLMRLHGSAIAADGNLCPVMPSLMDRVQSLLKVPSKEADRYSYYQRNEREAEIKSSLQSISEAWPTIKEMSEFQGERLLATYNANADVHAEFSRLRLDLHIKESAAKQMFHDATLRCRKQQFTKLNERIRLQDEDRVLTLITFIRSKEDVDLSLGITYHRFGIGWLPRHELRLETLGIAKQKATLIIRGLIYNDSNYRYSTKKASFTAPTFLNVIALQTIRPWYIKPNIRSLIPYGNSKGLPADPWELFPQPTYGLDMSDDERHVLELATRRDRNRFASSRQIEIFPGKSMQGWDNLFPAVFPSGTSPGSYGFLSNNIPPQRPPSPSPFERRRPTPFLEPTRIQQRSNSFDEFGPPPPPNRHQPVIIPPRSNSPDPYQDFEPPRGPNRRQQNNIPPPPPPSGDDHARRTSTPSPQIYKPVPKSQSRPSPPSPDEDYVLDSRGRSARYPEKYSYGGSDQKEPTDLEKIYIPRQRTPSTSPMAPERRGSNVSGGWDRVREIVVDDTNAATTRTISRENSNIEKKTKSSKRPPEDSADTSSEPGIEEELYDFDVEDEDDYTPADFSEETNAEFEAIKLLTLTTTFETNYPFDVPPRPRVPNLGVTAGIESPLSTSGHILARVNLPVVEFKRRCTPKDRRACHLVYSLKNTTGFTVPYGEADVVVDGIRLQDGILTNWGEGGMPELCLGVDQNIIVGYGDRRIQEVFPRTKDGKILSPHEAKGKTTKRRWLCQREVFLKNLHEEMVYIDVYDQVPVIDTAGMPSNADIKLDGTYGADVKVISPKNLKEGRKVHAGEPLLVGKDQGWGEAIAEQLEEGAILWNVRLRGKKGVKLVLEWVVSLPLAIVKNQGTGNEEMEGVQLQVVRPLEAPAARKNGLVAAGDIGRGDYTYRVDWRDGPQLINHLEKFNHPLV